MRACSGSPWHHGDLCSTAGVEATKATEEEHRKRQHCQSLPNGCFWWVVSLWHLGMGIFPRHRRSVVLLEMKRWVSYCTGAVPKARSWPDKVSFRAGPDADGVHGQLLWPQLVLQACPNFWESRAGDRGTGPSGDRGIPRGRRLKGWRLEMRKTDFDLEQTTCLSAGC